MNIKVIRKEKRYIFSWKPQVSSSIEMINSDDYNYNIMRTRFSEKIFQIWNIRLLEETNSYIFLQTAGRLAFIVLSNNRTQNCATDRSTDRQKYWWNNPPGTSLISFAIFMLGKKICEALRATHSSAKNTCYIM